MAIKLRAWGKEGEWIVDIENETWQFKDTETMKKVLTELINYKNMYGRVDKRESRFDDVRQRG